MAEGSVRARLLAPLVVLFVSATLGCTEETTGASKPETAPSLTGSSVVTTVMEFPEGLQAVIGRTETAVATWSAWCVTRGGVALRKLPTNYVLAVGERGSTIVYSDLDTGRLYLWHPGRPSPGDISTFEVPTSGRVLGDAMALSPDETTLALVRYESPGRAAMATS
jgi:hypothetical protein